MSRNIIALRLEDSDGDALRFYARGKNRAFVEFEGEDGGVVILDREAIARLRDECNRILIEGNQR